MLLLNHSLKKNELLTGDIFKLNELKFYNKYEKIYFTSIFQKKIISISK